MLGPRERRNSNKGYRAHTRQSRKRESEENDAIYSQKSDLYRMTTIPG